MNSPKLSICISTLNRSDLLRELIESIMHQSSKSFEVVISDGGSSDDTVEAMKDLEKKYDNLKFINPGRPVGLDEGYHLAVIESTGKYIWCMPDDDYIIEGAIEKINNILDDDQTDFLIVNLRCYTNDLKTNLGQSLIPLKKDLSMSYEDFKEIFSENIYGLSYMGTHILKREIWFENNPEDFYGCWFGTFAAMGESKKINKVKYIAEPIIHYRSACSCWTEHSFEIWYEIWPGLVNQFGLFSKKLNKNPEILYPWLRGLTLLKSRAMGEFNFNCYKRYIYNNKNAKLKDHISSVIISFMPIWPLNKLMLIAMLIFKRRYLYSIYTVAMSSATPNFAINLSKLFGIKF